jgi:hypothetical protein
MICRSGGNWKLEVADDERGNDGNEGNKEISFLGCGNIRPEGPNALVALMTGVLCGLCATGMPCRSLGDVGDRYADGL